MSAEKQAYDVAAYIWPSYTGGEPRTRMFWPEGDGEWETVRKATAKYPGHTWPRRPLWGYCNEADPYVMEMQINAAADHVLWSNAPITCYKPTMPDYTPTGAGQLVQQAEILEDLRDDATVDQDVVAKARAAIERDIAFLTLSDDEWQALYDELATAAGDTYDFPDFDDLELEITPEAAEAARFLVELLLAQN